MSASRQSTSAKAPETLPSVPRTITGNVSSALSVTRRAARSPALSDQYRSPGADEHSGTAQIEYGALRAYSTWLAPDVSMASDGPPSRRRAAQRSRSPMSPR